MCHGEADPWLAKACLDHESPLSSSGLVVCSDLSNAASPSQGKMAVITRDSDLFVYESIDGVLRAGNRTVLATGPAVFIRRFRLWSKHLILLRRWVQKIRDAGQVVVSVHEYHTSCKCPQETCNRFLKDKGNRSQLCPDCSQCFDRDQKTWRGYA